jgi:hypothetical protein
LRRSSGSVLEGRTLNHQNASPVAPLTVSPSSSSRVSAANSRTIRS